MVVLLTEILSILGCNFTLWLISVVSSIPSKERGISPSISMFFSFQCGHHHTFVANLDFHTFIYLHTLIICHLSQTTCIYTGATTQTKTTHEFVFLWKISFGVSLHRRRRHWIDQGENKMILPTKPRDNMVCIMKQHGNFFRLVCMQSTMKIMHICILRCESPLSNHHLKHKSIKHKLCKVEMKANFSNSIRTKVFFFGDRDECKDDDYAYITSC